MFRRLITLGALLVLAACASPRGPHGYGYAPRAPLAPPPTSYDGPCNEPSNAFQAAQLNAQSINTLAVQPFGHTERGWITYAVLAGFAIGSTCPPDSPGFAEALARWKAAHGLPYVGTMDGQTLDKLKGAWQERRPFLMGRVRKEPCPPAPDLSTLEIIQPRESHFGKPIMVRPRALAAYRAMVQEARRAMPDLASDAYALTIFSGFRSPEYDGAQCAAQGGCNGVARAGACSAHRTGLALDIVISAAPGQRVDSVTDVNRQWQAETPLYRWMVWNAGRFGFVPYPYEPWHWEWTGEAP